ncbi:hypothetical protein PLICRDRAFT_362336 [Plicaturopsis crispa FD-325 SS-3]|uniref:DUF6534 domain-containing protein n=1 Tax=Plicaturopsis crispa FD-325 SS-3 TaxID=944288 RepID=A0A0C9SKU8_PLICR|nr:hypothetical protein PLICRDRAFT_362336 [Plicaturopsis crispa FD-325 SS-3]
MPPIPELPSLDLTYGVGFVGIGLAMLMYGITCGQVYWYFESYPNDGRCVKTLVLVLWAIDSFHQALIMHAFYHYLVTNFANPLALETDVWTLLSSELIESVNGMIVEFFFLRRLWIMSDRNKILCLTVLILVFTHLGLSIAWIIGAFSIKTPDLLRRLLPIATSGLASAGAADFLTSSAICYYLYKRRSGLDRTNSIVSRLMVYTVSTGLVNFIFGLGNTIAYVAPDTFVCVAFNFILARWYPLTVLSSLNSRAKLQRMSKSNPPRLRLSSGFNNQVHNGRLAISPSTFTPSFRASDFDEHISYSLGTVSSDPQYINRAHDAKPCVQVPMV